jgi:hypothetical protein
MRIMKYLFLVIVLATSSGCSMYRSTSYEKGAFSATQPVGSKQGVETRVDINDTGAGTYEVKIASNLATYEEVADCYLKMKVDTYQEMDGAQKFVMIIPIAWPIVMICQATNSCNFRGDFHYEKSVVPGECEFENQRVNRDKILSATPVKASGLLVLEINGTEADRLDLGAAPDLAVADLLAISLDMRNYLSSLSSMSDNNVCLHLGDERACTVMGSAAVSALTKPLREPKQAVKSRRK